METKPSKPIYQQLGLTDEEYQEMYERGLRLYEIKIHKDRCVSSRYQVVFTPDEVISKTEIEYPK